jgi:hypothetical protein
LDEVSQNLSKATFLALDLSNTQNGFLFALASWDEQNTG